VIGDYTHPTTRLPGAGGAPEIAIGELRVAETVAETDPPMDSELSALRELLARG
jgi:acyl CoA:acetate/3-ketoacid CoA transferase beta subunit